jgi:hypothetical protein
MAGGHPRPGSKAMLRHECVELIQRIEPVFEGFGYDLKVGDQVDDVVEVFVTDIASEIEDPRPVEISADIIRRHDIVTVIDLVAARCPYMALLRSDHEAELRICQTTD